MAFGLDDLVTGGLGLLGSWWNNEQAEDRQAQAQEFNAQQSAITREFNAAEAQKSREFSAHEALLNRDYQTTMSNSAFQRGMADMRAAGLNPILAYSKGGSSTPGGAMGASSAASGPSASSSPGAPTSDIIGAGISTAMQSRARSNEAKIATEQIKNLAATNEQIKAQTEATRGQAILSAAQTGQVMADTKIKDEVLSQASREAGKADIDKSFYETKAGKAIRFLGTGLKELNPFLSSAATFNDRFGGR